MLCLQQEFRYFPGTILMTSNCLMPPMGLLDEDWMIMIIRISVILITVTVTIVMITRIRIVITIRLAKAKLD